MHARVITEDQTEWIGRFLLDGTLTFVNDVYYCHFGKKRKELVGRPSMPFISEEDGEKVDGMFDDLGE